MVPEGWSIQIFENLVKQTQLGTTKRGAEESNGSTTALIKMGNLTWGGFNLRNVEHLSSKKVEANLFLAPGDFLFNTRNTPDLVGKSAVWKGEYGKATFDNNINRITFNDEIDSEYICYYLTTGKGKSIIRSLPAGSTSVAAIYWKDLKKIRVILPPLPEQKKIARILSTWDQAITATERLLENSQQRKKGLMQQLLTGKKRLPGFEGEWHQYALTDVAKVIVSPVDKKSHPEEKPVQLCNYTDVYYNTRITKDMPFMEATAKDSEIEKYTLQAGDVVITKDSETPGDIAVPALVAEDLGGVICGYHLAILRARPSKLNGAFLNCLLSMPRTRYYFFSLATGATRFGLSVGAIHNAEVTLPPVPEQEAIANILTTCDDELEIISERLDRLKQEKKALMQQLLTGKRRVKVEADAA